jgi:hypothetical protein
MPSPLCQKGGFYVQYKNYGNGADNSEKLTINLF